MLATDVVWVAAGEAFPLETIARVLAARLGEQGAPLAARVPLLRGLSASASSSRSRAGTASLPLRSGAELPVLALNQVRLVLRLAQAHGWSGLGERWPELVVTAGAAFGLRALARELLARAPGAGWAVRGAVAYAGTRALGDAARGCASTSRRYAAAGRSLARRALIARRRWLRRAHAQGSISW